MLMFSLEYKKSLCHFIWIKKGEREGMRDVDVNSRGVSDKTMEEFYSTACRLCQSDV